MKPLNITLSLLFFGACFCIHGKDTEVQKIHAGIKTKRQATINADKKTDISGIEFGFSDSTGTQILMIGNDTLDHPSDFTYALSDSAKLLGLKFIRRKKTHDGNSRETFYNFTNCGGFLYQIISGIVDKEHSVLILTKDFLSNRKLLDVSSIEKKEIPAPVKLRIESDRKRKIKNAKGLVHAGENRSIYLVEFNIKHDSALAALVYITPDRIVYHDFTAAYNNISTWRVDDGGEFGIDDFKVLEVFENMGSTEIVTEWVGEEGYSIEYIKEEGAAFKILKTGYRYTAPM